MKYYLVGIKGTGMTSLACFLKDLGYYVIGSDTEEEYFTCEILKKRKIETLIFNHNNITSDYIYIIGNAYDNENEEEIVEDEIVSPDYVPIDWENASIISSNDSIGDYSINFTGEVPSIVPGSVITIDQDSIIRYVFVESVEVEGNTLSMKTSQAYLTDIFANTTITLTTDNSRRGNNVFYPIEAFYYDDKGNRCEIDLNATRDDNFGFTHNIWNFSDILDGMELLSGDNYKLYMEKLSYNFNKTSLTFLRLAVT